MSEGRTTFFDRYARGEATEGDIEDDVARWHDDMASLGAHAPSLAAYLGLTETEYAAWVEDGRLLSRILLARLEHIPLAEATRRDDAEVQARIGLLRRAEANGPPRAPRRRAV
jgi:hypothetical protein